MKLLSHVQFLATPGAAAHQAPPSMGFSRQEYWRGVPLPSPLDTYIHIYEYTRVFRTYVLRTMSAHNKYYVLIFTIDLRITSRKMPRRVTITISIQYHIRGLI